jgi:hypothetical protein
MRWFDVDGARDHISNGGGKRPSRKTVYGLVQQGMKVARVGENGRRLMFCAEWVDEFLCGKVSVTTDTPKAT